MQEMLIPLFIIIITIAATAAKAKKASDEMKRKAEGENAPMDDGETDFEERRPPAARPAAAGKGPAPARMGEEGRDACHEYMLDDPAPLMEESPADLEARRQTARELLQGVIMSEVLRRPSGCRGRRL